MTRTYELGFIVDPRQSDDAVQEIAENYKGMIEASGATVTEVDIWGRRKLAYPIQKFTEGKYVFLYISSENGSPPFPEIERLMRQSDQVLRYLTVRTDLDLKRAARKGKPGTPGGPPKVGGEADDEEAASAPVREPAAAAPAAAARPASEPAAATPDEAAAAADEVPAETPAEPAEDAAPAAESVEAAADEAAADEAAADKAAADKAAADKAAANKAVADDTEDADDTAAASDEPVTEKDEEGDDHGA